MRNTSLSGVLLLTGTLLFSATPALTDTGGENVKQQLSAYNDRYNQIAADYDINAFLALYNDSPLWIAPTEQPVAGLDVPRATFEFMADKKGLLAHSLDHVFVSDDGSQAVMIGEVSLKADSIGIDSTGTYLFVLERQEAEWKIVVDMYNTHAKQQ